MKILSIGDSLTLPGHGNEYENTWIKILKSKFSDHDFITFFKRHLTTEVLNSMGGGDNYNNAFPKGADCLEHYMPDIVILQLGIVDCAPRLIKEYGMRWKIIRRMPNKVINRYIKYLKTKERDPDNVKVSKIKFELNLINYLERCHESGVKKLIYISIPIPDERMISKNKSICQNVNDYNSIIYKLKHRFNFIEVIDILDSKKHQNIYDDGYHPNPLGNQLVADSLIYHISKFLN